MQMANWWNLTADILTGPDSEILTTEEDFTCSVTMCYKMLNAKITGKPLNPNPNSLSLLV